MEYSSTDAHRDDEATAEPWWLDRVAALALEVWRDAATYFFPEELNEVDYVPDDKAGQEQVVEQLASWSLLPPEIQEMILGQLPVPHLHDVLRHVSHEMAAQAQGVYQRKHQPQEEANWQQAWTEWGSDPTTRFATTQEAVDAALCEPDVDLVCVRADPSQTISLSGSRMASVRFFGSTRAWIRGEGLVELMDNVLADVSKDLYDEDDVIVAYDHAVVNAHGYVRLVAEGFAVVTASGHARISASGGADVTVSGNAVVNAFDSVPVTATGDAEVYTHGENTVRASERACIWAVPWTTVIPSNWPNVTWVKTLLTDK